MTNTEQNYHTDNSYNNVPPEILCLLYLRTTRRGAVSGIINFRWALRKMRRRYLDLAHRLFETYYFELQREHAPCATMVT